MRTSKTPVTVEEIKSGELYGVLLRALGESAALSDDVLLRKLFAAEDYYERDLGLTFGPRRVFSRPAERLGLSDPVLALDALDPPYDPIADISEPAYDYRADLFQAQNWGLIQLRRRPIRSRPRVIFTWPAHVRVWTVPIEYVEYDGRAGTVQIRPTSGAAVAYNFNAFIMSLAAGTRGLPHSIMVDYEAGLSKEEMCADWQDLLEGLRLRTLLSAGGILGNVRSTGAQNVSLSLDGLSHSRGYGGRYGPYSGMLELALKQEEDIRNSLRGHSFGPLLAVA